MSLPLAPGGIHHSPRGTGVNVHASIFRDNRMAVDVPGSPSGGVEIGGGGCTADVMAFFSIHGGDLFDTFSGSIREGIPYHRAYLSYPLAI